MSRRIVVDASKWIGDNRDDDPPEKYRRARRIELNQSERTGRLEFLSSQKTVRLAKWKVGAAWVVALLMFAIGLNQVLSLFGLADWVRIGRWRVVALLGMPFGIWLACLAYLNTRMLKRVIALTRDGEKEVPLLIIDEGGFADLRIDGRTVLWTEIKKIAWSSWMLFSLVVQLDEGRAFERPNGGQTLILSDCGLPISAGRLIAILNHRRTEARRRKAA
jgi:hypothetical protein